MTFTARLPGAESLRALAFGLLLAAGTPASGEVPPGTPPASRTPSGKAAEPAPKAAAPAPLGLPLGEATVSDLKARIPNVQRLGTSRITRGPVYRARGSALPVPGFREATFVFDRDGRLAAVDLRYRKAMDGSRFRELVGLLAEKYELKSKEDPFVGTRRAELLAGTTQIVVIEPHLSFEGTVLYETLGYVAATLESLVREQEEKSKRLREGL